MANELNEKTGVYRQKEEYRPIITMCHTQFNALVEGNDFELTITGEVKFKNR
jgi:CRISPR-associated endonuclease Csn1